MKFQIDRQRWARGEDTKNLLLDEKNHQCCVGMYLSACGVPNEILANQASASTLAYKGQLPGGAKWLVTDGGVPYNSKVASDLYNVNDHAFQPGPYCENETEKKIKEIFATQGVEVEFVG